MKCYVIIYASMYVCTLYIVQYLALYEHVIKIVTVGIQGIYFSDSVTRILF